MREIIFRGKRCDNGEYVYGSYCHAEKFDRSGEEHYIIEYEANGRSYEVIPETIGQYTGLTDKNGKNIFEGDICKFREWSKGDMCWVGKVHYEYQQFVISGNPNKECESPFTLVMSRFVPENIEIIGNIHDNPELLEEKND